MQYYTYMGVYAPARHRPANDNAKYYVIIYNNNNNKKRVRFFTYLLGFVVPRKTRE